LTTRVRFHRGNTGKYLLPAQFCATPITPIHRVDSAFVRVVAKVRKVYSLAEEGTTEAQ